MTLAENHIIVFSDHKIRRAFHENAWWFAILDVIAALSDSTQPAGYIKDMRKRDSEEYAILTAEISKATFGLTPTEYKKLKGLDRENLRDHMTDLELIFTMLGEASTTAITRKKNAQGFDQNRTAAKAGGKIAGKARKDLEKKISDKVTTSQNYLGHPQKKITDDSKK